MLQNLAQMSHAQTHLFSYLLKTYAHTRQRVVEASSYDINQKTQKHSFVLMINIMFELSRGLIMCCLCRIVFVEYEEHCCRSNTTLLVVDLVTLIVSCI